MSYNTGLANVSRMWCSTWPLSDPPCLKPVVDYNTWNITQILQVLIVQVATWPRYRSTLEQEWTYHYHKHIMKMFSIHPFPIIFH